VQAREGDAGRDPMRDANCAANARGYEAKRGISELLLGYRLTEKA